jgi:hypothetical protein
MKCAKCSDATVGKSKYCAKDRDAARAAWVEMISNKPSKEERDAKHLELHMRAATAGVLAAEAVVVTPMHVVQHANPLDDSSPVVRDYGLIESGVCGFAWINVTPGNSSFALWLKKTNTARRAYTGGVQIWVSDFGQSMTRKEAYAAAYAEVIREAGLKAYAGSRMD